MRAFGDTTVKKVFLGAQAVKKIFLTAVEVFPRFPTGFNPGTPIPTDSWTTAGTGTGINGFDIFSNDGTGGFSGENTTTGGNRMALSAPTFGIVVGQNYYFECDIVSTNQPGNVSIGLGTNVRSNSVNFPAGFSGTLTGTLTITNTNASGCSVRVLMSNVGTIVVSDIRLWLSPVQLLPGDSE